MKNENLIVVAVVGVVALLMILGIVGLNANAKRIQANRQAEQKRLIAEQEEQERLERERERLATEQREREEQERQRLAEEQERQRLAEEQRQRVEQERQRFAEEQRQLEEQKRPPEEQKRRADALDLNEELHKSGFTDVNRFIYFGGSSALRDEWQIVDRRSRDDPLDDQARTEKEAVWAKIQEARKEIARKTFFSNFGYSVSHVNNRGDGNSTFDMSIDTNIKHPAINKVSFPFQNVRSDGKNLVWFYSIEFSVSGDTANIRELVNNKSDYQARIWLTNLQEDGSTPKANVYEVEILKLPEEVIAARVAGKEAIAQRTTGRERIAAVEPEKRSKIEPTQNDGGMGMAIGMVAIMAVIALCVYAYVRAQLELESEQVRREFDYKNALSELQKNPSKPELRNKALALGRILVEGEKQKQIRNKQHIPKYTEQSLSNDLMVCLSGNTSAPVNTAEEIQKLNDLYSSGIISQEEFERGKALFLGTPKDRSQQILEALSNLHQLKKQGAVSESEYNMTKWELLSGKLVK